MGDDVFRSYRNHNTFAREGSETSRAGIGDLLAELAQLTGQGDPYRDSGRDDGSFQARADSISRVGADRSFGCRPQRDERRGIRYAMMAYSDPR